MPPHSPAFARSLITHHRKAILIIVGKAKAHRAYRARLAAANPSALQFYPERLDLLSRSIAHHRRLIAEGYASLRVAGVGQADHRVAA